MRVGYDPAKILAEAAESLALLGNLQEITKLVARSARELCGADGATFVLSDENQCFYIEEDSISPLWKGARFNKDACVSGWVMKHGKAIHIPNVFQDERVPAHLYRPTFVKSLCMMPMRPASPMGALGVYWANEYFPSNAEMKSLQALANCAAISVENIELKLNLDRVRGLERNLTENRDDLEQAVYGLAHDLRNPLCTIVALSDLLRSYLGNKVDLRSANYIESISRVGMSASNMIGQILAMYRLSGLEIKKQKVDLSILGLEVEEQLRLQLGDRRLQVKVDDNMIAFGDPILLKLLVDNLFMNAMKFSKTKSEIYIHFGSAIREESNRSEFFVKDRGVGFAPGEEKKLFRSQIRLHDEREFRGTGLGLSSVAKIVEAHGGTVRAEGHVGEGATFYFQLPEME